jgi:hypothetical protein
MRILEYTRKTGWLSKKYALSVVLVTNSQGEFMQEFRHIKEAIAKWRGRRGKSCESVMFVFTSDPQNHQWIRDLMHDIYHNEVMLGPLLQALDTRIALLNPGGEPVAEYALGRPS